MFLFGYRNITGWNYYRVKLEQGENCQKFQQSGVLEFRTGVLEIRDLRQDIGKGRWDIGHW